MGRFFCFLGVSLSTAVPKAWVGLLQASLRFGTAYRSLRSRLPHPSRKIRQSIEWISTK